MARQARYRFSSLGKTIVNTGSVLHGHKQLMGSLAHRNTMFSTKYGKIGVGVAYYNGRHNIKNVLVAVSLFAN